MAILEIEDTYLAGSIYVKIYILKDLFKDHAQAPCPGQTENPVHGPSRHDELKRFS